MPNDFNPQKIWQEQPAEKNKMSLEDIHRKMQQLERKDRLTALISIVMGTGLCIFFAYIGASGHMGAHGGDALPRIGCAVLSLWSLYEAWHGYKWLWPRSSELAVTWSASLQFYIRELEKRRDYQLHVWQRAGLTWCFVGVGLLIFSSLSRVIHDRHYGWNAAPFIILTALWFPIFFRSRKRKLMKLEQEIDTLKGLETENR